MDKSIKYIVESGEYPVTNPLKGFAPWSTSYDRLKIKTGLAFVLIKWSELEPEEGQYAFDEVEEKYHMDYLRKENVRFVIRIVADYPSDEKHMDIPQWLYDKTYGSGQWYDNEYGKGFSPDYYNIEFIRAHERLINAVGERYRSDENIAYIELGSLGHWGEWHVNSHSQRESFPLKTVSDKYVKPYLNNFPSSKLLLRRPYDIGKTEGLGLYNDSFGEKNSHDMWLSWINLGYISDQNGEKLSDMRDFYKIAPSGGEFSSVKDISTYYMDDFDSTMEYVRESHTTFLGPHCGAELFDSEYTDNVKILSASMGYCFRLGEVVLKKKMFSKRLELSINIENCGVAPIYEDFDMYIRIVDGTGNTVCERSYDIGINNILPGSAVIKINMDDLNLIGGRYRIYAGLIDPLTGKPGVAFANENGAGAADKYEYLIMEMDI